MPNGTDNNERDIMGDSLSQSTNREAKLGIN